MSVNLFEMQVNLQQDSHVNVHLNSLHCNEKPTKPTVDTKLGCWCSVSEYSQRDMIETGGITGWGFHI